MTQHTRMNSARHFACRFMPAWVDRALPHGSDPAPVIESIGAPDAPATTLTQARIIFTLAHLHLVTATPGLLEAARRIYRHMIAQLRDKDGGFRLSVAPDGGLRRSYDQSFALLALATLHRADPDLVSAADIDACWDFIATKLTAPDGSLWEDDRAPANGGMRSQNPHMHMLEAALQCYEMTGATIWLARAKTFIDLARRYFIDAETGAVREFVGPDLMPLDTTAGQRREPGHQYEWAWLLRRYAGFSGDKGAVTLADRMQAFAEQFGLRKSGPLHGAPYDALDAQGRVVEASHLLWPLTEAGKLYAAIHRESGDPAAANSARHLEQLVFERYFAATNPPCWVNQLDGGALALWDAALSRLLYHVAIFVTEGMSANLWQDAGCDTQPNASFNHERPNFNSEERP
ncbi:AGE family epimerase/isomerase [Pseudorhodobacter sp.]|uniref:AGE family epimerase/isomerase n=1 Tax=Pseudorhodobacter sp. TaxID=1934400 RepID=UPI0026479A3A|nr:AGE family epimerase/isomerase [Pseudorhodobacter sp.]MDN5785749.1 AGE family epimerase/isomerase [Pseudorhodobacter sp.]